MSVRSVQLATPSAEKSRHHTLLAPRWAHEAADWIVHQPANWNIIGATLGLIMLLIGGALLFGGGYTSIQGVRIPLALLLIPWGIVVPTDGMPPLTWWIIPLVTNLVQTFARQVRGLRALWWPSIIFDTTTTGVFLSYGLLVASAPFRTDILTLSTIALWGMIGTGLAFLITITAERFFLAGVLLIWIAITRRH